MFPRIRGKVKAPARGGVMGVVFELSELAWTVWKLQYTNLRRVVCLIAHVCNVFSIGTSGNRCLN